MRATLWPSLAHSVANFYRDVNVTIWRMPAAFVRFDTEF
jgi:hypothetical protein